MALAKATHLPTEGIIDSRRRRNNQQRRLPKRGRTAVQSTSTEKGSTTTAHAQADVSKQEESTEVEVPEQEGKVTFRDVLSLLLTNMFQAVTATDKAGGIPLARGTLEDLGEGPLFLSLFSFYRQHGPVYKLVFGPKSFVVVSDPTCAKEMLRKQAFSMDKGVLAEILEPIMGKGLIPADLQTWKKRRRAIVPGFHERWLEFMCKGVFGKCATQFVRRLKEDASQGDVVDMEERWNSYALDIIGLSVFNYDFGSITQESPVIQAVYNTLKEAEHRSTFYVPYWKLPGADQVVPRQKSFREDLELINETLTSLIRRAQGTRQEADVEELKQREYESASDPSLLRFLVDLRGEEATDRQLRDDLMTMLIAGHETTASVLTWATYCIACRPDQLTLLQEEVDSQLSPESPPPSYQELWNFPRTRRAIAESLRLYPQPPLLIRRALEDVTLPGGSTIPRGQDVFLSVYNIHRSPEFWDNPDSFDITRWDRPATNDDSHPSWTGYSPDGWRGLYPDESSADFAFLPFGGGPRKCVGDQFATIEGSIGLATFLRHFEPQLATDPSDVGMVTGATIHTDNGLPIRLRPRTSSSPPFPSSSPPSANDSEDGV